VIRLLDTDVLVDALRGRGSARDRLAEASPDDFRVSSVAVAELAYGARLAREPARADLAWRALLEPLEVVPFDAAAAERHAELRLALRASPIGERDLIVAATAVAHGLVIVTRNVREFGGCRG
jgi:tRNA(fMet)-specific endonuclease VapC